MEAEGLRGDHPVLEVFVGANFSRGQVCVGRGQALNSCTVHGVWCGIYARAGTHAHPERSSQRKTKCLKNQEAMKTIFSFNRGWISIIAIIN